MIRAQILPGTGRWQAPKAADGGAESSPIRLLEKLMCRDPSTVLRTVPLPVPGRINP